MDPLSETRQIPPLLVPELIAVQDAVKIMLEAIPADAAGRDDLASALEKLDQHWCWLCPVEARDLLANAHNAVVNYGSPRAAKKMRHLLETVNRYDRDSDAHFRATNEFMAQQPQCARLPGCVIKPGGHWHDDECPVEKARRT